MNLAAIFLLVSSTYNIPQGLLSSLCYIESGHNVRAVNKHDGNSPSKGICQMKLTTARLMGYHGSEKDLMRPEININYAAKYLRYQHDRYHGDWARAITAYNQGTSYGPGSSPYFAKVINHYLTHLEILDGQRDEETNDLYQRRLPISTRGPGPIQD